MWATFSQHRDRMARQTHISLSRRYASNDSVRDTRGDQRNGGALAAQACLVPPLNKEPEHEAVARLPPRLQAPADRRRDRGAQQVTHRAAPLPVPVRATSLPAAMTRWTLCSTPTGMGRPVEG